MDRNKGLWYNCNAMRMPSGQEISTPNGLHAFLREVVGVTNEMTGQITEISQRPAIIPLTPDPPQPEVEITRLGLEQVPRQHQFDSDFAPGTINNAAEGFGRGSFWVRGGTNEVWICIYADLSTANWIKIS